MLLGGTAVGLGLDLGQSAADAQAGVARLNDVVDVAKLCSLVGIGEEVVVLLLLLSEEGLGVLVVLVPFRSITTQNGYK